MTRCDPLRVVAALVLLTVGSPLIGCSGSADELPREAVTGTVQLDGQPLNDGSIMFMPAVGQTGAATPGGSSIRGGRFSIGVENGLIPGNYKVSINSPSRAADRAKPAAPASGKAAELPKELIPKKYNSNTELVAEVKKGGPNNFDYSLESK